VSEVSGDAMEDGLKDTARTAGYGGRGEAVAEVDSRAHTEAHVLGMPKHCGGGIREGSPLSLHLSELVACVWAVN
jgi:hypothetical protein